MDDWVVLRLAFKCTVHWVRVGRAKGGKPSCEVNTQAVGQTLEKMCHQVIIIRLINLRIYNLLPSAPPVRRLMVEVWWWFLWS